MREPKPLQILFELIRSVYHEKVAYTVTRWLTTSYAEKQCS